MEVSRRKFIGSSAAAVLVAGTTARGKVFGAGDRVRICCIGIHGRGGSHINAFCGNEGSQVVALCDVDSKVLERRAEEVKDKTGAQPKIYTDMREVMADDSIDAITIATPNHWHSLAAIWGCKAGKDVYVEKPLSHNVWEGRRLAEAAVKYGRIVQHGTQSRSDAKWMRDIRLMHDGFIGEIHMGKGFTYKSGNRGSIGFAEFKDAPPHLNWTLWQGPAREKPYCDNYVHYNWHWFWEYGNGETGNQLVHQVDVGVWGINSGLPTHVHSAGGRYVNNDQGETPNMQVTTFKYANGRTLLMEVRNAGSYMEEGSLTTGNTFFGAKGYYVQGKGFFDYDHKPIPVDEPEPETAGTFGNFLAAVRSRKPEDVHGNAEEGHISSVHCHLGNISYRLGRSLEFDPKTETFIGDEEANAMLKRDYRPGFEIPEVV